MTYTVERIAGGTYSGSSAAPGGTTSSLTTDGPDRFCVAVCFTERQLNGGPDYHEVASVSGGSGLTWQKIVDEDFTYDDVPASASFPNNYWHCDVFKAFAATQQTAETLTFSMAPAGDTFVNHGWAVVFVIDGAVDLDTDLTNLVVSSSLSGGGATTITSGSIDTDTANPLVMLGIMSHKGGGAADSHTIPSGYSTAATISGNSHFQTSGSGAGGQADISVSFLEYGSAQSGLTLTGTSEDYWWTVAMVFAPAAAPTANALVTSVAAEVMHTGGTPTARVTAVDAEVLHSGDSSARVSSVAAEILVSTVAPGPIDGSRFLEARFQLKPTQSYAEADYDSIWALGDRNVGGHVTFGEYDLTTFPGATMASSQNGNYAHPTGSGLSISSNPLVQGAAAWMDFGTEFVDIRGFKMRGTEEFTWADDETWSLQGGFGVGTPSGESYASEFDEFVPSQATENVAFGLFETEFTFSPRNGQLWSHYEFVFGSTQSVSNSRFANEIEWKVAHSSLDGGDRRLTNSRPDKRVTFAMSSHWTYRNDVPAGFTDPADALFDGVPILLNFPAPGGTTKNGDGLFAQISKAGGSGGAEQDQVGAYFQFTYPREVIPRHIMFVSLVQVEEYDSGDLPMHYGTWHWEFSKDGTTWVVVGSPWSFREDAKFMMAPRSGAWDLNHADLGQGASRWRMVLNSGPAFRSNYTIGQIIFDLIDPGSLATNFRIDFTDDVDGVSPTVTVVGSSPYNVKFSDGSDDVLTFELTNTPNFSGSVDFSDGTSDVLNFVGSFTPTFYPQVVVVATGRR